MPAWREGIAATGLPMPCSTMLARSRPVPAQPLLVIRSTAPMAPSWEAIHGGAMG